MKTIEFTNRYGYEQSFTMLEDGNILWRGDFNYCRFGFPNNYDEAYQKYQEDGGELSLDAFKKEIHRSEYDDSDEYIGPSEIMGKYANHIISDQSVIDMVDPSGGPYMTQGMKVFDKEIKEFKPHPDGYLIITI